MLSRIAAVFALVVAAVWAQPAQLSNCGGNAKWTSLTITPTTPQAGQTASINATGIIPTKVTGGSGQIAAYMYGAQVFQTNINTCGTGQQIDILGMATGVLDALPCPVPSGGHVAVGFVLPIPSIAGGLGTVNITLQAFDTATPNPNEIICIDLVVNL